MPQLTDREWLILLDGVREIHEAQDLDTFADRTMAVIGRLIASDYLAYNELNPAQQRALTRFDSDDVQHAIARYLPVFERLMPQHPILNHFIHHPDSPSQRMSDLVSKDEYQRLDLYQEVYRHIAGQHQIVVPIPAQSDSNIGVALNRARSDFSDRDRLVLDLLQPHLAQVYRSLTLRLRARAMIEGRDHDGLCEQLRDMGLTHREAEVLAWVLHGKTNPETAAILDISPRTIDKHLENVFRKLGVCTRTGAILIVLERLLN